MPAKVFIGQPALDAWLSSDAVDVQGGELTFHADGRKLRMTPGAHFIKVSGDGPDPNGLLGKVKDETALAKLGAEQYMNSVILGDTAYDVEPGFVAEPADDAKDGGEPLRAALQAAAAAV